MYQIAKAFEFSAAHQLVGLPETHPCSRLHGHNYTVTLVLEAEDLDGQGFVIDYNALASFKTWLDSTCDHRFLNEVMEREYGGVLPVQTTAENIARWFFGVARRMFHELAEVRVSETPKTWASYRPTA